MKVLKIFFVVTIFLLIVGSAVYSNIASNCSGISPYKIAQINLAKIEMSISEFNIDTGHLPKSLDQLLSDHQSVNWMGPYVKEKELTDPWGEKYHYQTHHNKSFMLSTFAEDKKIAGKELAQDIVVTGSVYSDE